MYKLLLVRYGELGLKGKNKSRFIKRLTGNIKEALKDLEDKEVVQTWDRIWVKIDDDLSEVVERLQKVFGIYSMSPVLEVESKLEEFGPAALTVLKEALPAGGSFKISTKRADKRFPINSIEVSQTVAKYVFQQLEGGYRAKMKDPEQEIHIEIRSQGTYIYGQTIPGAKGLPYGCGNRALLMISGGIDSPVAGWMALKRGVVLEAVHFHSFPFTSERAKEKVIDLCQELTLWGGKIRLHVVHFTDIQKTIYSECHEEYGITLMRRMMYRIAERIVKNNKMYAIYNGESVGQVASQTLESIYAINEVTSVPVLRPLVGLDKEEIIERAKNIGTFETSILPYEDCCTVFLPKYPKIRPRLHEVKKEEDKLDIDSLLEEALTKVEVLEISPAGVETQREK